MTTSAPPTDTPIDATAYAWPRASLDAVDRMRALAVAMPHVALDETVFDVPFARFWSYIADLDRSAPEYEGLVARARVVARAPEVALPGADVGESAAAVGKRIVLDAKSPLAGPWIRFDVVLRPGWCLMRSRFGQVGMAARPEGDEATRFVHFEGSSILGRLGRPLFAWNIRQDFRKLEAHFSAERPAHDRA